MKVGVTNNKTRVKLFVKKWTQRLGLYSIAVRILGVYRGLILKFESDAHRAKRKNALQITTDDSSISRKNVVLIVVDSFRSDHASLYGYEKDTTPFLDSIAAQAVVGQKHYTSAPWTWPTVNSILTGLYPRNHGAVIEDELKGFNRFNFPSLLPYSTPTIVDILEELGYTTRFFSGVVTADLAVKGIFRRNMSDQVRWEDVSFGYLSDKLRNFVQKQKGKPFFTYVQSGDLHMPISIPGRFVDNSRDWVRLDYLEYHPELDESSFKEKRKSFYDAAIAYTDEGIRLLVDFFKEQGLYEDTLFIVTADHGEELWDHDNLERRLMEKHLPHLVGSEHGYSLFEEMIHVPFMIFGGGITPKILEVNTSHVDIVPTLLNQLDIKTEVQFDGEDVFTVAERTVFAEECGYGYEQKAAIGQEYKYISSDGYGFKLYEDIASKEIVEIGDDITVPSEVHSLQGQLADFVAGKRAKGVTTEADDAVRKRLEQLGYM